MTAIKLLQNFRQNVLQLQKLNLPFANLRKTTSPCYNCIYARQLVRNISLWGLSRERRNQLDEWNRAVSEAEKIVGYPTSFMSLRCLLSDELSNVALEMRKLVGTSHPLLKTARTFFYDGKHSMQTRGLLVLLMSKAAGPCEHSPLDSTETMVSGIYPSQRTLAEIAEMMHTAQLIHKGVVNLDTVEASGGSVEDMDIGNKMAVLSGDFLLATACTGLAGLNNTKVVEMIASSLGDLMRAEFTALRDWDGLSCLPEEGATLSDWEQQTFLGSGSLIANSCRAAMLLANHDEVLQQQAFQFGENTAFAYQIHEDLEVYINNGNEGDNVNVASAPIMLHLTQHPADSALLQLLHSTSKSKIKQLQKMLKKSGAVAEAQELCRDYSDKALHSLDGLASSPAKTALENIVYAVTS